MSVVILSAPPTLEVSGPKTDPRSSCIMMVDIFSTYSLDKNARSMSGKCPPQIELVHRRPWLCPPDPPQTNIDHNPQQFRGI